jgi:hypothetical protein
MLAHCERPDSPPAAGCGLQQPGPLSRPVGHRRLTHAWPELATSSSTPADRSRLAYQGRQILPCSGAEIGRSRLYRRTPAEGRSPATTRIVPPGVFLPNPTVFTLDDELGLLVLRQFSSTLDGVGLAIMERVRTRGAVSLNCPAATGARFDRDLRLSSHTGSPKESGKAPAVHPISQRGLAQGPRPVFDVHGQRRFQSCERTRPESKAMSKLARGSPASNQEGARVARPRASVRVACGRPALWCAVSHGARPSVNRAAAKPIERLARAHCPLGQPSRCRS